MIEKEYKLVCTKEQFFYILKCIMLSEYKPKFITKVNKYYDYKDLSLNKNNITFKKILVINNEKIEYKCTVKEPTIDDSLAVIKKEINLNITPSVFHSNVCDVDELNSYSKGLIEYGSLTTNRTEFKFDNFKLCLDINTYLDINDYEIEIELIDANLDLNSFKPKEKNLLNNILNNLLDFETTKKSKRVRFFDRLSALELI